VKHQTSKSADGWPGGHEQGRVAQLWSGMRIYPLFVVIWSWLADKLHFILSCEAGFLWANHPQSPPSLLQDYSICYNARLISNQFLLQVFDPNEWCLKNGLLSGGLNPRPLSHESSALTTRPGALKLLILVYPQIKIWPLCIPPNQSCIPFAYPPNKKFYPRVPPVCFFWVVFKIWRTPCKLHAYP
jgi:hypothetical protein